MHASRSSRAARCGLSLVEATMSMVIVSVMIAGALRAHAAASANSLAATRNLEGGRLAGMLLDEIVQCRYEEPEDGVAKAFGREAEGAASRSAWDDVDDYDGFTEGGAANLTTRHGAEIAGTAGWSWQAAVEWTTFPGTVPVRSLSESSYKKITVTVTSPQGEVTTRVALRTANGLAEQPLAETADVITFIDLEVRFEDGSQPLRYGIATPGRPRN